MNEHDDPKREGLKPPPEVWDRAALERYQDALDAAHRGGVPTDWPHDPLNPETWERQQCARDAERPR